MVGTPVKLPASVAALRRNLATVGQDELHTALYKTTQVDDGLPPKEKHVRLLVRAAATEAERASAIPALVMARGHKISEVPELPLEALPLLAAAPGPPLPAAPAAVAAVAAPMIASF